MDDEAAFVEEIRRSPHDVTPRLIYADFLEDLGDPRGELIRVQCELADRPAGDRARAALFDRERELLERYGDEWLGPLREHGAEGVTVRCFVRGLIERVQMRADWFLRAVNELCRISPALAGVDIRHARELGKELAAFDVPEQITELDFSGNRLTAAWVRQVGSAGWTSQIESLNLQMNSLADDGLRALMETEWPRLRELSLGMNRLGPDAAGAIATWGSLVHLESLDLRMNPIGDIGLTRLARSELVRALQHLNLASCDIGSLAPLTESTALQSLTELILRANRIPSEDWELFRQTKLMQQLRLLDTRNNAGTGPHVDIG